MEASGRGSDEDEVTYERRLQEIPWQDGNAGQHNLCIYINTTPPLLHRRSLVVNRYPHEILKDSRGE
jgi:hypothetical protein